MEVIERMSSGIVPCSQCVFVRVGLISSKISARTRRFGELATADDYATHRLYYVLFCWQLICLHRAFWILAEVRHNH